MTSHTNEFGKAIGFPLEFTGPWPRPKASRCLGAHVA